MMQLLPAIQEDAFEIEAMARAIWYRHYYPEVLSGEEIDYFLKRMYSPSVIKREMAAGVRYHKIAYAAQVVGFLAYHHEAHHAKLRLHKLYVRHEYHGRGIGRFALEQVKQQARELNVQEIYLYVFRKNARALRVYQRAGFVIVQEDYHECGDGYAFDDYVMAYYP